MKYLLLSFCLFLVIMSCKKDPVENRSAKLILLQNTWTPISSRIFFPNGSSYLLISPLSETFTKNGYIVDQVYVTTSTGIVLQNKIVNAYKLLPNDTILVEYNIVNGITDTTAYPSIITTLTDHLLVIIKKNNNFIQNIDSLKR
ncbi:MAG TPA: hypothetical protein VIH57_00335 [Bacteroidales bacterium]